MGRNKKSRSNVPFNPPVRNPIPNMVQMGAQLQKEVDRIRTETQNDVVNLILSTVMIVLREFCNFDTDKLNIVLEKTFEQLELASKELVTTDQLMDLCGSYGLEVRQIEDKMEAIGSQMQAKIRVFDLLDKGMTEVEDLAKTLNITSREAAGLRWQWNKEKYGIDYEEDIEMVAKRVEAFKLFDQDVDTKEICEKLKVTKSTCDTYKSQWRKEKAPKTPDELADAIFGKDEAPVEKKHYVAPINKGIKENEEFSKAIAEMEAGTAKKADPVEEAPIVKVEEAKKKGLRKIVQVVKFEGDMATYTPFGDEFEVEIDGQILVLNKADMTEFANEMLEVAQEI